MKVGREWISIRRKASSDGKSPMATHTLTIPNWHPARLNELLNCHWAERNRRKKQDKAMVACYKFLANVPEAEGRRRVSLKLTLGKGQRRPDKDAWWKSTLDALVACGLLVDDSPDWCEPGAVEYARGATKGTVIVLEDLQPPAREVANSKKGSAA